MRNKGYGGRFIHLSVCSINISPLGGPAEKMKFIIRVNLAIKLFILCEILSLSRFDNFKLLHGAIGYFFPFQSNKVQYTKMLICTCVYIMLRDH